MPKRGQLKPMDEWEESIRNNATHYNVVGFKPGRTPRLYESFEMLWAARAYAVEILKQPLGLRCAMIYAVNEEERFALVGTVDCYNFEYKEVKPKHY